MLLGREQRQGSTGEMIRIMRKFVIMRMLVKVVQNVTMAMQIPHLSVLSSPMIMGCMICLETYGNGCVPVGKNLTAGRKRNAIIMPVIRMTVVCGAVLGPANRGTPVRRIAAKTCPPARRAAKRREFPSTFAARAPPTATSLRASATRLAKESSTDRTSLGCDNCSPDRTL